MLLAGVYPVLSPCRPGWILTTGSLIITTFRWIAARFRMNSNPLLALARAFTAHHTMVGYSNFEAYQSRFPGNLALLRVVRDEQEAVYDSEIRESYLEAESYLDHILWLTGSRGNHRLRGSRLRSRLWKAMQ
jgi:hypothetical protein